MIGTHEEKKPKKRVHHVQCSKLTHPDTNRKEKRANNNGPTSQKIIAAATKKL